MEVCGYRPNSQYLLDVLSDYLITMPAMYARGILFGKMVLELGDSCVIKNERTGMSCDIEFKTKVCHEVLLFPCMNSS